MNIDTVFEAASMGKPVFAYLVLKLVEQGILDLDKPLRDYLDEPYRNDETLHEKIITRMVLTHTGGFPNWRHGGWRKEGPIPVLFEPGTQFKYSGEGFWYLQQVVEHIVGERMGTLIKRRLFDPLEMRLSSYVWMDAYDSMAAGGHDKEGRLKAEYSKYKRDNNAFSLYTTPTDYALFLVEMMTADGTKPQSLKKATLDRMLMDCSRRSELVHYGLGWAIYESETSVQYGHGGANKSGFRCASRFDPELGRGIVIMTNGIGGGRLRELLLEAVGLD